MRELDSDPDVDVIVVARGGGSVEDLLPFSDETLCRAIAACRTPVVSAVGHEPDNPLCDLVADLRAATPTDAAKKIVPDTAAEQHLLDDLRRRSAQALRNWVGREERVLAQLRSRPVLAEPLAALAARADEIHRARSAVRRDITRLIDVQAERVGHLSARLATLGPAATLARGYAVVQTVGAAAFRLRCCDPLTTPRRGPRCGCGSATARSRRRVRGRPMASDGATPISQLGYEKCRDELIEVVRLLEQGGLDLDASLTAVGKRRTAG